MSESASANPKDRVAKPALDAAKAKEARKEKLEEKQKEQREAAIQEKRTGTTVDWKALREDLAALVKEKGCHPILIRLSWHDSGTYCAASKTGGPRSCMRFSEGEITHGANAGLDVAQKLLEPIRKKYEGQLSTADLWAFAAVVAIKEAGGPDVPFRYGRKDAADSKCSVEEGRLPDGDKGADHLRDIFHRMGFSDKDIVTLSGAHTLGSCHADRSGFDGFWSSEPLKFDNTYFSDLFNKKWEPTKVASTGNPQYKDDQGLMMLESDIALRDDEKFCPYAKSYAEDQSLFFKDFANAFQRLQEFGYSDDDLTPISS